MFWVHKRTSSLRRFFWVPFVKWKKNGLKSIKYHHHHHIGIGNDHNFSVIFPRRTCNFSSITCLRSFRLSKNQTSLFSYRDSLETWNFPCCRCTKQASDYESRMQQNQEGFSVIYCAFESSKTPIKILHMLIGTFVARRCGNYKFHEKIVLYS